MTLWTCSPPGSSLHGILCKNTRVGCHALLQGIFPTQGSNQHLLCLLHWQVGTLPLIPPGKPSLGRRGLNPSSPGMFVFLENTALLKPLLKKSLGALKTSGHQFLVWKFRSVGASGKQYWLKCAEHFKTAFDCTFKTGNANWNSSWGLSLMHSTCSIFN